MFFWPFLRLLFPYFSWQQFSYLVSRAVGTVGGQFAPPPLPDFVRLVNPIPIRGQILPLHKIFRLSYGPGLSFSAVAKSQGKKIAIFLGPPKVEGSLSDLQFFSCQARPWCQSAPGGTQRDQNLHEFAYIYLNFYIPKRFHNMSKNFSYIMGD